MKLDFFPCRVPAGDRFWGQILALRYDPKRIATRIIGQTFCGCFVDFAKKMCIIKMNTNDFS